MPAKLATNDGYYGR